jgi:hypothetical protein
LQIDLLNSNHIFLIQNSYIGFEFEFFSDKGRNDVASELSKTLKKKVVVANKYHSDVDISYKQFKIEPDFSGGKRMFELVTYPLNYFEAKTILINTLSYIKKNGYTTERCALHVNISFNHSKFENRVELKNINPLNLILDIDEDYIYNKFPTRKNSVYARSVKWVSPVQKFNFHKSPLVLKNHSNVSYPKSKYYGINFSKLKDNYLEFRYLGGKNYENKIKQVLELTEYFILLTGKELLNNNSIVIKGENDRKEELEKIVNRHQKIVNSIRTFDYFLENYNNRIKLSVDLKFNPKLIETYYYKLREKIYEILIFSNLKQGWINYDSDKGKVQLKSAHAVNIYLMKDWQIVDCKFDNAIFESCEMYSTNVDNSKIQDSLVQNSNTIENSKIINSMVAQGTKCKDCYIDIKKNTFNGKTEGGIIRSAKIGSLAKIDDKTEIISSQSEDKDKIENTYNKLFPKL